MKKVGRNVGMMIATVRNCRVQLSVAVVVLVLVARKLARTRMMKMARGGVRLMMRATDTVRWTTEKKLNEMTNTEKQRVCCVYVVRTWKKKLIVELRRGAPPKKSGRGRRASSENGEEKYYCRVAVNLDHKNLGRKEREGVCTFVITG